jgi:hypothetical protein
MAAVLHLLDQRRLIDSNGISDGASIAFYLTGTTTPVAIYADVSLTTPLTNPVVVGAGAAVPAIYLDDSITYRRVITYSDGSTDDDDPYTQPDYLTEAQASAAAALASQTAAETAETGAESARDEALVWGTTDYYATWAALNAVTGAAGDLAAVIAGDTGTHTDPVVGGTVDNAGYFRYDDSPAGWERVGDLESQLTGDSADRAEAARAELASLANASVLADPLTVEGRLVQPLNLSFDLYIIFGVYLDTGEFYQPLMPDTEASALMAAQHLQLVPVTFGERLVQPLTVGFDLYIATGIYLDTGELFAAGITTGEGADRSMMKVVQTTDSLSICFAAAHENWTEYVFKHDTGTASGGAYDIWHLDGAWDVSMIGYTISRQQQLLRDSAEVETAIWTTPAGSGNFVGGKAHGAQELSEVVMFVDGAETSLAQISNYAAKRIEVYQTSVLNAYGTATKLADLLTRWTFEGGKVTIGCTITWTASPPQLKQTYLSGILPVFRTQGSGPSGAGSAVELVTAGRRAPLYAEEDLSTSGYSQVDTTSAVMTGYGAGGYSFRIEKTAGWSFTNRASYYAPTVTNKFYQNVYGTDYTPSADQQDEFESVISIFNPN